MGYADYSGLLESTDNIVTANGSTPFTHKLDAAIPGISLQPSLMYEITKGLRLHAGFDLNYLLNQTYSQKEEISSPNGTFFPENTRVRNATSGDIKENAAVTIAPGTKIEPRAAAMRAAALPIGAGSLSRKWRSWA